MTATRASSKRRARSAETTGVHRKPTDKRVQTVDDPKRKQTANAHKQTANARKQSAPARKQRADERKELDRQRKELDRQRKELDREREELDRKRKELDEERGGIELLLSQCEERMRLFIDHLPVGAVRVERGRLFMNEAAERITGYLRSEITTVADWLRCLHPGDPNAPHAYQADHEATGPAAQTVSIRRKDGQTRDLDLVVRGRGGDLDGVWVLTDVTEANRLEEALAQAHKMEALGALASGIAHDFNNLLAGIIGCTDIALGAIPPESSARPWMDALKSAARSGASVVAQLMAFGRGQDIDPEVVDLCAVVARSERMLHRMLGEDIDFHVMAAMPGATVRCGPGRVEQMLMNLVTNARNAMPRGGALQIEVARTTVDGDASLLQGLTPGPYVTLSVRDTGVGMTKQVQARVFEPFFTTRRDDGGMGLGLSTVYGIARQSGGHVTLSSSPGRGTTVTVYLPHDRSPAAAAPPGSPSPALRRRRTVLLVEDDTLVRLALTQYLESDGYCVVAVSDGQAALAAARSQPRPFDLLLTDVVLPGRNGLQIAEAIRAGNPGTRVLFMSGGDAGALIQPDGPQAAAPRLQKPFDDRTLLAAVHRALTQPESGAAAEALAGEARGAPPPSDARLGELGDGAPRPVTVLFVDDNDLSRPAIQMLLEGEGLEVLGAASEADAVRHCNEHAGPIDVLVTDVSLPGQSGGEIARSVLSMRPKIRVVYVSGYDEDEAPVRDAIKLHPAAFLRKPIDAEALLALLGQQMRDA